MRRKLVDRIQKHALDAGPLIKLLFRNLVPDVGLRRIRAHIAIVIRPAPHLSGRLIEKDIVDAPGVDTDAVELRLDRKRLAQPVFKLQAKLRIIPVNRAVLLRRAVCEAMHLGQRKPAVLQPADHRPPARGPQIKCQKAAHQVPLLFFGICFEGVPAVNLPEPVVAHADQLLGFFPADTAVGDRDARVRLFAGLIFCAPGWRLLSSMTPASAVSPSAIWLSTSLRTIPCLR